MRMRIRSLWRRAAAGVALCGLAATAAAVDYPTRPITILVGFAAGGATDLVARMVGQKLSERLGQPVVIDNRAGAGGTLATALAAKAAPDGHTLLMVSASHAINVTLYRTLPYDAVRDFEPVAACASTTNVLAVHPSVPARTVAEFIALAKAKPGAINLASAGAGSSSHLAGELFKSMAGIQTQHVPYKGTADALRDLISGEVQATVDSVSAMLPAIRNGSLRALGVGDPHRSMLLPDVPTIAESGLPGYEVNAWVGLLAPARTPRDVVDRVNREVNDILRQPDIVKRLEQMGSRPIPMSSGQFSDLIGSDIDRFAKLIRNAGVTPL
ncbi:MAG: Bug family tripartite tricarboxylate transporter substrate binding protein [Lautropia sp.]